MNNSSEVLVEDLQSLNFKKKIKIDYDLVTNFSVGFFICAFGIVSNILILCVVRKQKNFYLQYLLAIGDLVYCFSFFTRSPTWIYLHYQGLEKTKVPNSFCFLCPWIYCLMVGFLWANIVTLGLAVERFIASYVPIWYKNNWEQKAKQKFLYTIYLALFLTIGTGFLFILFGSLKGRTVELRASFTQCTGVLYGSYKIFVNIFGTISGIACAVLTTAALWVGKKRRAALNLAANDKFLDVQRKMERTVTAVVLLSIFLVTIPNLWKGAEMLNLTSASKTSQGVRNKLVLMVSRYCTLLNILNSAINFCVYLTFNSEFRKHAKSLFFNQTNTTEVKTMTANQSDVRSKLASKRVTPKSNAVRPSDIKV